MSIQIIKKPFGNLANGNEVFLFEISNNRGFSIGLSNYGGIINTMKVPDRTGNIGETVLGHDSLDRYLKDQSYLGCIVGRFANRIKNGSFEMNGRHYQLAQNDGKNHLHGGKEGFDKKLWKAEQVSLESGPAIELSYLSEDGEEHYPGNLFCKVRFKMEEENELSIEYKCTTDKDTVVGLTHHEYFNLKDGGASTAMNHLLKLNANHFTKNNSENLPTGEIVEVKNSPMDFTERKRISDQMNLEEEQLKIEDGYNHNFMINKKEKELNWAAEIYEESCGRKLTISTTKPGLQFYAGSRLEGNQGRGDTRFLPYHGFAIEAQNFPDAPNQEHFPSAVLRVGEVYNEKTVYKFEVE